MGATEVRAARNSGNPDSGLRPIRVRAVSEKVEMRSPVAPGRRQPVPIATLTDPGRPRTAGLSSSARKSAAGVGSAEIRPSGSCERAPCTSREAHAESAHSRHVLPPAHVSAPPSPPPVPQRGRGAPSDCRGGAARPPRARRGGVPPASRAGVERSKLRWRSCERAVLRGTRANAELHRVGRRPLMALSAAGGPRLAVHPIRRGQPRSTSGPEVTIEQASGCR